MGINDDIPQREEGHALWKFLVMVFTETGSHIINLSEALLNISPLVTGF